MTSDARDGSANHRSHLGGHGTPCIGYLSEFDFRYNARKVTDGERTLAAIKQTGGKRLVLRDSRLEN